MHLVLDQWFNQTLCVRYFPELVSVSFGNGPVNKIRHYFLSIILGLLRDVFVLKKWIKSDTVCYRMNWLDQGYILYFTSYSSRYYVLATLLRWFWAHFVNGPVNQSRHHDSATLLCLLWDHYVKTVNKSVTMC